MYLFYTQDSHDFTYLFLCHKTVGICSLRILESRTPNQSSTGLHSQKVPEGRPLSLSESGTSSHSLAVVTWFEPLSPSSHVSFCFKLFDWKLHIDNIWCYQYTHYSWAMGVDMEQRILQLPFPNTKIMYSALPLLEKEITTNLLLKLVELLNFRKELCVGLYL